MKYPSAAMTCLALLALSSPSSAADLSPRVYTKAPVYVNPSMNWTGFYVGVNGGYSWGKANITPPTGSALATSAKHDLNGGLGGGQWGYNWQMDRTWVLGIEADIQGSGERGNADASSSVNTPLAGVPFNNILTTTSDSSWRFPWFATLRGRIGLLATPDLLLYGTGGLAVGDIRYATQTTVTGQLFGPGAGAIGPATVVTGPAFSETQTRLGWTLGAGVERKFDKSWSAKLEYLCLDFGSATYFSGTTNQTDVNFHDHIFRAGLNYKIGGTTEK